MNLQILLFLLTVISIAGCSSLQRQQEIAKRSDDYRIEAYGFYESGHCDFALGKIKEAIKETKSLQVVAVQSVEVYDDAGLYYYSSGKFKESAYHQSVAVLLAYNNPEFDNMFSTYMTRLGWAYGKYKPGYDFREIEKNPLTLLDDDDLDLKANNLIRIKFYKLKHESCSQKPEQYTLKSKWTAQ